MHTTMPVRCRFADEVRKVNERRGRLRGPKHNDRARGQRGNHEQARKHGMYGLERALAVAMPWPSGDWPHYSVVGAVFEQGQASNEGCDGRNTRLSAPGQGMLITGWII